MSQHLEKKFFWSVDFAIFLSFEPLVLRRGTRSEEGDPQAVKPGGPPYTGRQKLGSRADFQ